MRQLSLRILAFATAPLLAFAPARAQQLIEAGKTVTGAASASDEPAMYMFVGEVGSTVTFDLKGAGPLALDLFDGEGQAILSAEGDGKTRLEAVLPFTEIYMVAVRRGRKSAPFSLAMAADVPDLQKKLFAYGVGYGHAPRYGETRTLAKSCWLDPGRKSRSLNSDGKGGTAEVTLGRDGMEYTVYRPVGAEPKFTETKFEFDGVSAKFRTGKYGYDVKITDAVYQRSEYTKAFHAYLCE